MFNLLIIARRATEFLFPLLCTMVTYFMVMDKALMVLFCYEMSRFKGVEEVQLHFQCGYATNLHSLLQEVGLVV